MLNSHRLLLEVGSGITLTDDEVQVYLKEAGLIGTAVYDSDLPGNRKKIYQAALAILNSIANDPIGMKNYKVDTDLTISQFAENIQNRIDQLERQIRTMPEQAAQGNTFMLFSN